MRLSGPPGRRRCAEFRPRRRTTSNTSPIIVHTSAAVVVVVVVVWSDRDIDRRITSRIDEETQTEGRHLVLVFGPAEGGGAGGRSGVVRVVTDRRDGVTRFFSSSLSSV